MGLRKGRALRTKAEEEEGEDQKEEEDSLDNPKHAIRTMLSNRTIIESWSSRILIVNSRESSGSVYCSSASSRVFLRGDLHFPESKPPASVDLLHTLVPSDKVAVCYLSAPYIIMHIKDVQVHHPRYIQEYPPVQLSQRRGLLSAYTSPTR